MKRAAPSLAVAAAVAVVVVAGQLVGLRGTNSPRPVPEYPTAPPSAQIASSAEQTVLPRAVRSGYPISRWRSLQKATQP